MNMLSIFKKINKGGNTRSVSKKNNSAITADGKANTKQTIREVVSNNIFLLGMMYKASPSFVILTGLDSFRNQISIFFEHTVLIGYVLEAAEFGYPFGKVASVIILLALLISLGMVFTVFVGDYISEKERPKVRREIKLRLYEKAREMDLSCYDDPDFYNNQVLAISEVDKQIERGVKFIQDTVAGITVFITTGAYFFTKDKLSIVFAVVSFVLTFGFNQVYNKQNYLVRIGSNEPSRKRDYVKRIYYLSDYAKEIRLNPGVSDILFKRFEEANDEVYEVERKYIKKKFVYDFARKYLCNDMFSDVLYIAYLVIMAAVFKRLSFSTVAILYGSFGRLKNGLRVFTDVYPYASETSLYVAKIREFLRREPQIVSTEGLDATRDAKEIELKDVCFKYGSASDMLLKNINLHIKKGEKIALVGYNGAGKTTLVKLLMRLYDVCSGEIDADGIDIRRYDVESYRDTVGTVFQDFKIFGGNVKENVVLDVADGYLDEAVMTSLEESGLAGKVKRLANGIDTELTHEFSQEGVDLSGGEGQKLAISRVFFKDAGLMILDEPSSALDPIAEYQLNHAMLSATGDKTVIFISHRLSTTRNADRIIMLEQGQIVEEGSHEELLSQNGRYAQMWKVQAGAYIAV